MANPTTRRRPRAVWLAPMLLGGSVQCPPRAQAEPVTQVSSAMFQQQVVAAEQTVAACRIAATACDAGSLPLAPEQVSRGPGAAAFPVGWQWLRDAIDAARTGPAADRVTSMQAAEGHLAEWATEPGNAGSGGVGSSADFVRARRAANGVLARSEFSTSIEGPSWFDRQVARLMDWVSRLFLGMDRLGTRNPWLAGLIEWSCFLLAVGGLLFLLRRSLQRQTLRIALGEGAAVARRTDRDAADWTRLAEEQGATGEWREAIHCLYWAAIASLEARRAWRFNPSRTPREYLRLLRAGSEAERALGTLTRSFERVWYGHAEADEAAFGAAQANFAAVQRAELRVGSATGEARQGEARVAPAAATAGTGAA